MPLYFNQVSASESSVNITLKTIYAPIELASLRELAEEKRVSEY